MYFSNTGFRFEDPVWGNLPFVLASGLTLLCICLVWLLFWGEEAPIKYVVNLPPQLRSDYEWDVDHLKNSAQPEASTSISMGRSCLTCTDP